MIKRLLWVLLGVWGLSACSTLAPPPSGDDCPPPASYTADLITNAQKQARNRGFLWRIERGGQTSYLYGSVHVGKAAWMAPGPQMREALGAVDTVALEVHMSSQESQAQWQEIRSRPQHKIAPELSARLARLWAASCLPPEQLGKAPVELQAISLAAQLGRRQGFEPAYSSEALLTLIATGLKLPLVSLESMKGQLSLVLASNEADAAKAVAQALDSVEKPQTRAMQQRITSAWNSNDLPTLERFEAWCDCMNTKQEKAGMKKLLDDRNPGLADGIARLHASGTRVFAAVGALHMIGPTGLPLLLAERGFAISRVY